ncbi:MAG: hypothetical protein ABI907_03850 [Ramlibacter sp.]
MNRPFLLPLQLAALAVACVRGFGEFASLQRWRFKDRFARRA